MGFGGDRDWRPPKKPPKWRKKPPSSSPPPPPAAGRAQRYCVSLARSPSYPSPAEFGGNVTSTTYAADGSQSPPDSSASQSQNPAGSSVVVEEVRRLPGQATERAKLGLLTPDSVVVEEVPEFSGQATERATSGVPNPDSEALGCLNEGSEKALVVQLHGAPLHGDRREDPESAAEVSHGFTQALIAFLLPWARSLDYDVRQKICEYILPNGEKAGKSSSKGNLAESSDAPYAKRQKPSGVRRRNKSFVSEIRLRGMKNKFWLGTYKTEEEAAQAFQAAADWREARRDSKSFNKKELDDLKKHLSDDRSHHNVASTDLASLKGKAVASPEHVSQRESPAQENVSSPSEFFDWEPLLEILGLKK